MKPIRTYRARIESAVARGDSTEHTHRPTLKALIEDLDSDLEAINEPKRNTEVGAPDMRILRGAVPVGYIETKDVDANLNAIAKTEQLRRYRRGLANLVLTNYTQFDWFRNGELVQRADIESDEEKVLELLTNFLHAESLSVSKPGELAERMAGLALIMRHVTEAAVRTEIEDGTLHTQLDAFRKVLIHDLAPDEFADMYAQTIAYGLFAAKCSAEPGKPFTRQSAPYALPKTNPFLRRLFGHIAGPELDDRLPWVVDDLVSLLNHADIAAILKDFGKRTRQEDPVVHFYEDFLRAYDPDLREVRGVYYTPEPVVSYIVRSVDHILKTDFGITDGLADSTKIRWAPRDSGEELETHRLHVLDPAVGTGTFLYHVIRHIHQHFVETGNAGRWPSYVPEHLLPRVHGFELLMAPYAVAHMKLGILLQETGYDFSGDERLGVYLTNSLAEAFRSEEVLPFSQYLVEEANAAGAVKKDYPVMVVLGNPPYSGHSANRSKDDDGNPTFIGKLLQDYYKVDGKALGEKNPKWLQDDYVKFIRFAQWRIERTGQGILAFITNHGYLDNPTFRGMRQSLMRTFDKIYVLDLHGNTKKKETAPGGGKDENVFDIQQGVAICVCVRLAK
ncbi:MAG: N-6 DNA methylase [Armatimonadota bacterium]